MPLYVKTTRLGGAMRHNFWTTCGNTNPYCWPLPAGGQPGAWLMDTNPAPLRPHHAGINLAPLHSVLQYISTENYLAEAEGETVEAHDCVVARRVRLLRGLPASPRQWRKLGLGYARTAIEIIGLIDHVRPYLQENAEMIARPINDFAALFESASPSVQPEADKLRPMLAMQLARFAHDIPSSGIYTGPAKSAWAATRALDGVLMLVASRDERLDHADQVKTVAYYVREAAANLAEDYVEHRGRCDVPDRLAELAGVPLAGTDAPDDFARQVRKRLYARQNGSLLAMWSLSATAP